MKIIISQEKSGERVDKFLAREFLSYTRGELTKQIKNKKVLVNNKSVRPSYILKVGDVVSINLEEKIEKIIANSEVKFEIIYTDENIIVLNKPAGLQVHPSSKDEINTLVNGLIFQFPEIETVRDKSREAWKRPGIVHRLDRETSGIMVVAKNQKTYEELKNKFKNREIEKVYVALVHGKFTEEEKSGVINKPLARSASYEKQVIANDKTKTIVRTAVTEYSVLEEIGEFSFVELRPKTGRMHQLRVHLTSIGHPILGDQKYALKKFSQIDSVKRHLLHAKSLSFVLEGKKYEFVSDLPEDFQQVVVFLTDREKKDSI